MTERKPPDKVRSTQIQIRLSPRERATIEARAAARRMTVSEYLRAVALG